MTPVVLTAAFAIVAVVAFAGAVVLEALGHDATGAWTAFAAALGLLSGQHIPTPGKTPSK